MEIRTHPLAAAAVIVGSILLVCGALEMALRIEEGIRLDPSLATRLPAPAPVAKRPGGFRVLALGDSFTRGVYVPGAEAFPGVLERELRAKGLDAEALNFGIPGTNTVDQLALARELIPTYEPDILLLGFFANDIEKSRAERQAVGGGADSTEKRLATRILNWRNRSYLLRYLSPRLVQVLGRIGLRLPGAVEYAPRLDAVFRENRPRFQVCQRALEEIGSLASSRDVKFLVLVFPIMAPFDEGYPLPSYHRAVVAFCEETGLPVLDLLPEFRGMNPFRLQVSLLDTHPNGEAYALVAAAVERRFLEEGWLPDQPGAR